MKNLGYLSNLFLILQIFIEWLLNFIHCARLWGYKFEQNRNYTFTHEVFNLVWNMDIYKIIIHIHNHKSWKCYEGKISCFSSLISYRTVFAINMWSSALPFKTKKCVKGKNTSRKDVNVYFKSIIRQQLLSINYNFTPNIRKRIKLK